MFIEQLACVPRAAKFSKNLFQKDAWSVIQRKLGSSTSRDAAGGDWIFALEGMTRSGLLTVLGAS